ncbi:MAG: hypothetical protein WC479_12775 [Candidatus Izemoplasmatales bacterium]|jgi:hypothetical protein
MAKAREDYSEFQRIVNTAGFKAYMERLNKYIESYRKDMDNDNADGDLLKRYQLIKKGLEMARDIPMMMDIQARTSKGE